MKETEELTIRAKSLALLQFMNNDIQLKNFTSESFQIIIQPKDGRKFSLLVTAFVQNNWSGLRMRFVEYKKHGQNRVYENETMQPCSDSLSEFEYCLGYFCDINAENRF